MGSRKGLSSISQGASVCLFGAEELLVRLRGLFSEIPGVLAREDPENLHRMRVASRRIRSALPLMEGCVASEGFRRWNKAAQSFTRALGQARDVDVQKLFLEGLLENKTLHPRSNPGLKRLLLRLSQGRDELQARVDRAVQGEAQSQILHGMERTLRQLVVHLRLGGQDQDTTPLMERAREMLVLRLEEVLALGYVMGAPEFFDGHHDLRKGVKHLRYTLELFGALFPEELKKTYIKTLKELQTLLGDIHDLDVWGGLLPVMIEEERGRTARYYGHTRSFPQIEKGMTLLEEHVITKRKVLFKEAAEVWKDLEERGFWNEMYRSFEELIPRIPQEDILLGEGGVLGAFGEGKKMEEHSAFADSGGEGHPCG